MKAAASQTGKNSGILEVVIKLQTVDLFSIQEETDTIIILHALYADEQFGKSSVKGRIIIKCSDTDVLVLCVHYYLRMQNTD